MKATKHSEHLQEQKRRNSVDIYSSFLLGSTEIAIHVARIQEVVNRPEAFTKMPLAPDYLLGIFNLRGTIIPVLDLRALLGFESHAAQSNEKIAIVEHMGARVGILFDATGEVLRVAKDDISEFAYHEKAEHKVISGAIKLNNGERLLQVIDPMALFSIENLPQFLEHKNSKESALKRFLGQRKQCITFYSGGSRMAFEIEGISEILRVPELQESSMRSDLCLGVIAVRGQTIPVVDFARLLDERRSSAGDVADKRVIILREERTHFGLIVDAVESISAFYTEEIMPIPLLTNKRLDMFKGCVNLQSSGDALLLNAAKIFTKEEIQSITKGHSKLYESGQIAESVRKVSKKQAYITFRIDQLFGVPISEVREIIAYTNDILTPPGLPAYVKGMLNLRGQLVTVVDARILYGLPARADTGTSKILIFPMADELFGLVVDSVEGILNVEEDQKMKLPSMLYRELQDHFKNEIKEVFEVPVADGKKVSLVVLNVEALCTMIEHKKAA